MKSVEQVIGISHGGQKFFEYPYHFEKGEDDRKETPWEEDPFVRRMIWGGMPGREERPELSQARGSHQQPGVEDFHLQCLHLANFVNRTFVQVPLGRPLSCLQTWEPRHWCLPYPKDSGVPYPAIIVTLSALPTKLYTTMCAGPLFHFLCYIPMN